MRQYQIIDAIGPFVLEQPRTKTVNWSKVPFAELEEHGRLPAGVRAEIVARFRTYLTRVRPLGYDTLSLDDMAHMVVFEWYTPALRALLSDYQQLYGDILALAHEFDMQVLVNTDYVFWNDEIAAHLEEARVSVADFFDTACKLLAEQMPGVAGVILRIGESDGRDISDTFVSKLGLRSPQSAHRLLRQLLPRFEQRGKVLVVRTWTVGVYQIGDLIWNTATYDAVFGDLDSSALIVSMKYGDTDFMKYLALNPLLLHGPQRKILELQTRREWEGMGELPSCVAWQYEAYLARLRTLDTFVGISVWCQTGGWAKPAWHNVTYLQHSSFWVEVNTELVAYMYRDELTAEEAIRRVCQQRQLGDEAQTVQLLRAVDRAVALGLYVAPIAQQQLYFRRTRVPTLLWLTWDRVDISTMMLRLLRTLIDKRQAQVLRDAEHASAAVDEAEACARYLSLTPAVYASLTLLQETMRLCFAVKIYVVSGHSRADKRVLDAAVLRYRLQCPSGYTITHVALPRRYHRVPVGFVARRVLRGESRYRTRDKVLLKTSHLQRAMVRYSARHSTLKDQSMGIETLFK